MLCVGVFVSATTVNNKCIYSNVTNSPHHLLETQHLFVQRANTLCYNNYYYNCYHHYYYYSCDN